MALLSWKKVERGRTETADGRFCIEGHWHVKPGYYGLVDRKTHHYERGTKLKDLKKRAQEIISAEPHDATE